MSMSLMTLAEIQLQKYAPLIQAAAVGTSVILVFILIRISAVWPALSGSTPLLDFDAYLLLAQAVINHQDPYTVESMQTLGPPLAIAPYLPFAFLEIGHARITMISLQLVSLLAASWLIVRKYLQKDRAWQVSGTLLLFAIFFLAFPTRYSLLMGQPNGTVAVAVTAYLTNQLPVAGSVVAAFIKQQYSLLFLSFWRSRRVCITAAVAFTTVFLISLTVLPPSYYKTYLVQTFTPLVTNPQPATTSNYYSQTLCSTLSRTGIPCHASIPIVAVLLSALYLIKTGNRAAAVVCSVITAPVVWQHYFVVLLPVLAVLWLHAGHSKLERVLLLLATVGVFVEFPQLHSVQPGTVGSVVASHYFLSAVIVLFVAVKQEKQKRVLYYS